VRSSTGVEDEPALARAAGVLTASGGIASHAAIPARGRGIPAVCGVDSLRMSAESLSTADGSVVHEGDEISIDGSSGEVRLGVASVEPVERSAELDRLLTWADELRAGSLGVWANADTADDAGRARRAGAEGVGLCRAERLLLGPDRLPSSGRCSPPTASRIRPGSPTS
jgi:pyruvate,orthophosphate dikinase